MIAWHHNHFENVRRAARKKKSRAMILRIVSHLASHMDRDDIAGVWEKPIGARWFWAIILRAQGERALDNH